MTKNRQQCHDEIFMVCSMHITSDGLLVLAFECVKAFKLLKLS